MSLSPEACAASLARLPGIGPARLLSLIRDRDPCDVWDDVLAGRITRSHPAQPSLLGEPGAGARRSWAEAAAAFDVEGWWREAHSRGTQVTWIGTDDYPTALGHDPHPPGVLFWRGSLSCLERPRVAMVGTRSASPEGRAVAHEMARDLAAAGVCVVSGLALGIDGSAHRGALSALQPASTAGVAASGVDVPYPKRHSALWDEVARAGAVISETPPGSPAQAWRFPARNRIIAGLVQMLVVVESHVSGGSLITAEAAIERGVEVRVVPGPVNSPCCAGSNQLLYDGAGPVRCARDVLDALGMLLPDPPQPSERVTHGPRSTRPGARATDPGHQLDPGDRLDPGRRSDPAERAVLSAVGWAPVTTNKVALRSALPLDRVAVALESLSARGLVQEEAGWWRRVRS